MHLRSIILMGGVLFGLGLTPGCAVPQPRGEGMYKRVKEPKTGAVYHLYLPVDYVRRSGKHPEYPKMRKWPLVMTFHGMKPYDNAVPQEREWEQEADIYGYVVCAPELRTSDSFMEYPLTKEWSYVRKDRENVLAIMDHVFQTTEADPKRVLSTSWSCGGYLAHYFPNRYPNRFSCIATRLSNFSSKLLKEETVDRYRDRIPVAIYIGDGDFPACKTESEQAVAWYTARSFRTIRGHMIDRMGHERIPQTAAAFFAEQLGIKPLRPNEAAKTVAKVRMTDYFPSQKLIARMSSKRTETTLASANTAKPRGENRPPRRTTGVENRPPRRTTERNQPETTKPAPRRPIVRKGPPATYVTSTAGANYPYSAGRPNPGLRRNSSPASGAGSARVAGGTSTPRRSNLLIGDQPEPRTNRPLRARPEPTRNNKSPLVMGDRPPANSPSLRKVPKPRSSDRDNRLARNASASKPRTTRRPSTTPRPSTSKRTPASASRSIAAKPKINRGRTPSRSLSRARPVKINVQGPKIGTAPYYLSYSVDLPADVTRGADFLWKDNGLWIGDRPSGQQILDSPGIHRVSVLLVTKDNIEYRGTTTVNVLDPQSAGRTN